MTTIDLRPQIAPGPTSITLLMLAAAVFMRLYQANPHCTQEVSFSRAVFEMGAHLEDKGWEGPPLVYKTGFAWPMRALLGLIALGALFGPASVALACRGELITRNRGAAVLLATTIAPALASLLPNEIIGERFELLLQDIARFSVPLLAFGLLTLTRIHRWQEQRRRELVDIAAGAYAR